MKNLNTSEIYDKVLIYDDPKYPGNVFYDLESFFQPFSLYKVSDDLSIKEADNYCLYAYFLLNYSNDIESKFEQSTIKVFEDLLFSNIVVPYYNVVLAINSQQWVHVFLETYRMIEHVFPAIALKNISGRMAPKTTQDVAAALEDITGWRPPEENSIKDIFKEIDGVNSFEPFLNELRSIVKDPQANLYRWYYKQVRNQIVHYRAIHKNVIFSPTEWNILVRFNIHLIQYLYDAYKDQIEIGENTFKD